MLEIERKEKQNIFNDLNTKLKAQKDSHET